jgi:predicted porin
VFSAQHRLGALLSACDKTTAHLPKALRPSAPSGAITPASETEVGSGATDPRPLFSTLENFSMKKTLIALAAVAVTGAAFAQSSVTLYGVADAGIGQAGQAGAAASGGTGTATKGDTKFLSTSAMNNGTTRWGLRGVEDLGGGLKAGFNFEAGLSLADGAANFSGGQYFSRAANVSLMGGFGQIMLGRALTPSFFGVAAWELTSTANYSVVASQFNFAGAGSRNSSQIAYTTPNFGGLTASLGTILKDNNGGNAKYDMNVIYRGGPLTAALSYNQVKNGPEGITLGGKYDFGGFAVAASINDSETATGATLNRGFTVGVGAKLGPVNLVVDIARDTEAKDTDVLLEAKYPLSKRTFAYVAVLSNGDKKASTAVASVKNNYGIGIRHNF